MNNGNYARFLEDTAAAAPDVLAVIESLPTGELRQLTFLEMRDAVVRRRSALAAAGCGPGQRVLSLAPAGSRFLINVLALLSLGSVPVLLDPGFPAEALKRCLRDAGTQLAIASEAARDHFIGVPGFDGIERWLVDSVDAHTGDSRPLVSEPVDEGAIALVLFTTGSTGAPKGALLTHGALDAQRSTVRGREEIHAREVDLATFAYFSLFNVANTVTSVVPSLPHGPGRCDPAQIVDLICRYGVTTAFGAPALWARVAAHCAERSLQLSSLKRIVTAGAPVSEKLIGELHRILPPKAYVSTPYGATEALPICACTGRDVLRANELETRDYRGTFLGRPVGGMQVCIITADNDPIPLWHEDIVMPVGALGEIIVSGPGVSAGYVRAEDDEPSKIREGTRRWHRTGDVGRLDAQGNLWYFGRKTQRVMGADAQVLDTAPCEHWFEQRPGVTRAALVGVQLRDEVVPAVVIQPSDSGGNAAALASSLFAELREHELLRSIRYLLFRSEFPMDIRHNSKIRRDELAPWATEQVMRESADVFAKGDGDDGS